MLAARVGVVVVAGLLAASCVNLRYPPGASRDGGGDVVAHLGTGHACTKAAECQSGFCYDGVCCKTSCDQKCYTCAKEGNEGFCMPASVGAPDPRQSCGKPRVACGENGLCDGSGGCQKDPVGTPCKDSTCSGTDVILQGRCTADGSCADGPKQSCSPYVCSGGRCLTQCTSSADCVNEPGAMCDSTGSCGALKGLGGACKDSSNCLKGTCSPQGVCCASECNGPCESCALKGSEGSCLPVPAGDLPSDPTACTASDPATCGLDGTCDGAGACRNYIAGTKCSDASCMSATLRGAGTCDGKAHCQVPAAVSCGGFLCASATACRTMCTEDLQCASPSVCGGMQYGNACGGLSAQYFRQTNLTDLAISRTDPAINFHWFGDAPNPLLNKDNFSVRWHGKITPRFSEDYTFYASTDDGERLFIGGKLVIDRFVRKPADPEDVTAPIPLTAGQPVDVVLEYFEAGGDATAVLSWSSQSEAKAPIPTSALSPQ